MLFHNEADRTLLHSSLIMNIAFPGTESYSLFWNHITTILVPRRLNIKLFNVCDSCRYSTRTDMKLDIYRGVDTNKLDIYRRVNAKNIINIKGSMQKYFIYTNGWMRKRSCLLLGAIALRTLPHTTAMSSIYLTLNTQNVYSNSRFLRNSICLFGIPPPLSVSTLPCLLLKPCVSIGLNVNVYIE